MSNYQQILICQLCGEECFIRSCGDESWTVCSGCRTIEGPVYEILLDDDGNQLPDEKELDGTIFKGCK